MSALPLLRTGARVYFAIWLVTLCSAAIASLSPALGRDVRDALALSFEPLPATLIAATSVFLANTATLLAPLALAALVTPSVSRLRGVLGTGLVAFSLFPNVVTVGLALGAYGPRLLPFLPHLAVEWLALAVTTTTWLLALRTPLAGARLLQLGFVVALLSAAGAAVETYVGPTA